MFARPVISLTPETQERISPTFKKSHKNIRFSGLSPTSKGEKSIISSSPSPKASPMNKVPNSATIFAKMSKINVKSAGLNPTKKVFPSQHRRSSEMLIFSSKGKQEIKIEVVQKKKVGKKDISKFKDLFEIKDVFTKSEQFHCEVKKVLKNVTFFKKYKYFKRFTFSLSDFTRNPSI